MAGATVGGHYAYDPDGSLERSRGLISDGGDAPLEDEPAPEPIEAPEDPGPAAEPPTQELGEGTEEPPEPTQPKPTDPKAAWVAYAVAHGVSEEEANAQTKQQLQEAHAS